MLTVFVNSNDKSVAQQKQHKTCNFGEFLHVIPKY